MGFVSAYRWLYFDVVFGFVLVCYGWCLVLGGVVLDILVFWFLVCLVWIVGFGVDLCVDYFDYSWVCLFGLIAVLETWLIMFCAAWWIDCLVIRVVICYFGGCFMVGFA